jgi:hypothetical protein
MANTSLWFRFHRLTIEQQLIGREKNLSDFTPFPDVYAIRRTHLLAVEPQDRGNAAGARRYRTALPKPPLPGKDGERYEASVFSLIA